MSFLSRESAFFVSTGTDHIFGVTIWKHNFLSLTTERNKQLILSSNFLSLELLCCICIAILCTGNINTEELHNANIYFELKKA